MPAKVDEGEFSRDRLEMRDKTSEKSPAEKLRYPYYVFIVIITEACERFSFYGITAILYIYLTAKLKQASLEKENIGTVAKTIQYLFNATCYFTPILGSIMADSILGKFKTILYLGTVYAVGTIVLSLGAVGNNPHGIENFPNIPITLLGLFLIGVGTGGIKPCVIALGADQFKVPEQEQELSTYFAIFYASINIGSLISTILTPFLRKVHCMGESSCYTLAFGIPAGLMIIALVTFVFGKPWYTIVIPERNILLDSAKCIKYALTHKDLQPAGGHWLDAARGQYGQLSQDLKAVGRVGKIFLLYPLFWTLYYQQNTSWTIQVKNMNGNISGFVVLPELMSVSNPIFVLILIPIFDKVIYPLLGKCNLLKTSLQRVVTGAVILALAFIIAGVLELQLKDEYPVLPQDGQAHLTIHNGMNVPVEWTSHLDMLGLGLEQRDTFSKNIASGEHLINGTFGDQVLKFKLSLTDKQIQSVVILSNGTIYQSSKLDKLEKEDNGSPLLRVFLEAAPACLPATVRVSHASGNVDFIATADVTDLERSSLETLGLHTVELICQDGKQRAEKDVIFEFGGSYNLYILNDELVIYNLIKPNIINIFWILPQYFVLTVAEILFIISSTEFAYSQAPKRMKTVQMAMYYLTNAVGNLITPLIELIILKMGVAQWIGFFIFAGLMLLCSLGLMLFSIRYEYVHYASEDDVKPEPPKE